MHELSLIQSLLDIIEDYAARHRFERVNTLKLSFGRLSCLDPEALKFVFDVQSAGSRAEGADLVFEIHPARVACLACNRDSDVEAYPALCPHCRSVEVHLTGGTEELKLLEIDVD